MSDLRNRPSAAPSVDRPFEGADNGPVVILGDTQRTLLTERLLLRESNERGRRRLIEELAREADRTPPAFVVHLGDLVAWGAASADWKYYDDLVAPIVERRIPIRPVLGNHDYLGDTRTALAHARRRYPDLRGETWYATAHSGVGFVWLDSAAPDSVWPSQMTWLEGTLRHYQQRQDILGVIVFVHHPPYTAAVSRRGDERVRRDVLPRFFSASKTLAMFSGHVHGYERRVIGGRHFVVSGGGGGPRVTYRGTGRTRRRSPLHYLVVRFESTALSVEVRALAEDHVLVNPPLDVFDIHVG